ncbi:MAG: rod-binding protein [Gemmatimonadetes bacterium]|nr:rod-binding protein [Gemmatimonadota bacterium]
MTRIDATVSRDASMAPPTRDPRPLRDVAGQLEGVFVTEMFKAMRATVPDGGLASGGTGEEIFTGMMDGHVAATVPTAWSRGIAAAIARQLGDRP